MNRKIKIFIVLIALLVTAIYAIESLSNHTYINDVTVSNSDNNSKDKDEENDKPKNIVIEYVGLIDNNSFEGSNNGDFIVFRGYNIAQKIEKLGVDTGEYIYINYRIDQNQSKIVESIYKLKCDTGKYQGISNSNVEIKISGVPDVLPSEKFFAEDQVLENIKKIGFKINENIKFIYCVDEAGGKYIFGIARIDNQ